MYIHVHNVCNMYNVKGREPEAPLAWARQRCVQRGSTEETELGGLCMCLNMH